MAATAGRYEISLLSFSLDFTDCVRLSLPVESFALTHYNSQLVLVVDYYRDPSNELYSRDPSNELWVSADGINWQQSLPRGESSVERFQLSTLALQNVWWWWVDTLLICPLNRQLLKSLSMESGL